MNKLLLTIPFFLFMVLSCSHHDKRNLLFSCNGVMYTHMTDDSFQPIAEGHSIPMKISLYLDDKTVEMSSVKYEICQNSKTFIVFGNCGLKDLVNYYSFDLATHKMYSYDYYSESFRSKKNFPLLGESIRGEYSCELITNQN